MFYLLWNSLPDSKPLRWAVMLMVGGLVMLLLWQVVFPLVYELMVGDESPEIETMTKTVAGLAEERPTTVLKVVLS